MAGPTLASKPRRALRLVGGGARYAKARVRGGSFPFSMTFILTHRCNFRCAYCNAPDKAGEEMTTDEFKRALDEFASLGLVRASFSGGEALVRKDALEIARHAKSLGLMTSMNSNAWFARDRLEELAEVLDLLVVSLDGPAPSHDLLRRQAGSYQRVVDTLSLARQRGLAAATITVLTQKNLFVVEEVLGLASRHGFSAYFQPAYEDCFDHEKGFYSGFQTDTFEAIADQLAVAKEAGRPVGASFAYLDRLRSGPHFGSCNDCTAGRFWGTVMPDGRLVPCHLQSGPRSDWPSGLGLGFGRAFASLPQHKAGPGCAISPYQETDLIFQLNAGAIGTALRRLSPRSAH